MSELREWLDASILLIEARAERSEARGWFAAAELARERARAFRDFCEHLDRAESLLVVLAPPPDFESDALKVLAAIAAHRRYAAEASRAE